VFPHGLVSTASGDARPARGVIVTKDNKDVRAKGLQAGDIIVGLEGWQVENLQQYRAINSFFKDDVMKLRAWRGKSFDVTITAPDRFMGIEFRSYPIEGWAEE
jgi:S1-C subfamily serine protease